MAIISFWNRNNESSGKTLAMVATATSLAIQHAYKILIIDTAFNSYTIEDCFWTEKKAGLFRPETNKIELGTGITQLSRAILSNKVSPEIITNYTKVIFGNNRLEILTDSKIRREDYEKNKTILKQIAKIADKYYDIIFIDISKKLEPEITEGLLELSDIVAVSIKQNLRDIKDFLKLKRDNELNKKYELMPIITSYNQESIYNASKITKFLKEKQKVSVIPYNINFLDQSSAGGIANFFTNNINIKDKDKNSIFIKETRETAESIIIKIQELQTKM